MDTTDVKLKEIKDHWKNWAEEYGEDLRATTRSSNIKQLEIQSLIESISTLLTGEKSILEVGCGNGYNAISISMELKHSVDGFDFIPEMIDNANANLNRLDEQDKKRLNFYVDDVLNISKEKKYDLIYSCRCLINLPNSDLQDKAIKEILSMLKPGGYFLMLENFIENYEAQNELRVSVGLSKRTPAEFNLFFNDSHVNSLIDSLGGKIIEEKNFSSLHDIMQYVVVPMVNGGAIQYDHYAIKAVTKLLLSVDSNITGSFGRYGQNKLLVIKK